MVYPPLKRLSFPPLISPIINESNIASINILSSPFIPVKLKLQDNYPAILIYINYTIKTLVLSTHSFHLFFYIVHLYHQNLHS